MKKSTLVCLIVGLSIGTVGCSMDVMILEALKNTPKSENRVAPDFVGSETVQSLKGSYAVQAAFGEVSEKTMSKNGAWQIEGVFYE